MKGEGGKKLGNVTIANIHPSGTLSLSPSLGCCPPPHTHRLNNPTLDPSPDPAVLIGPGLSGSRAPIGGVAEQQAAGWTVRPSTHRGHMEQ